MPTRFRFFAKNFESKLFRRRLAIFCGVAVIFAGASPSAKAATARNENNGASGAKIDCSAFRATRDTDHDVLIYHWDDPRYSREERLQIAGSIGLIAFLAFAGHRKRKRDARTWR